MPRARKTTQKVSAKKTPPTTRTNTREPDLSYETRTIITILLLLFIYPVGLVFMWAWMHNWPIWLKLLLSIPLLLGMLAFFGVMIFIANIIGHIRLDRMHERRYRQWQITTTPAPTLPATITPIQITATPTQSTSGTY